MIRCNQRCPRYAGESYMRLIDQAGIPIGIFSSSIWELQPDGFRHGLGIYWTVLLPPLILFWHMYNVVRHESRTEDCSQTLDPCTNSRRFWHYVCNTTVSMSPLARIHGEILSLLLVTISYICKAIHYLRRRVCHTPCNVVFPHIEVRILSCAILDSTVCVSE